MSAGNPEPPNLLNGMPCPCGQDATFEECCGRYVLGQAHAPSPVALMRSRYTAYAVQQIEYLRQTQHPATQDTFDHTAAAEWAAQATWTELEVFSAEPPLADEGFVEFAAHYIEEGRSRRHHERSRFQRIDDRWYYADGVFLGEPVQAPPKVGRNEPCPCGSGKKYKKCCLKR